MDFNPQNVFVLGIFVRKNSSFRQKDPVHVLADSIRFLVLFPKIMLLICIEMV
mgnify:CR=1 FL=1